MSALVMAKTKTILFAALLLLHSTGFALSISEIELKSGLNQRLDATISLQSVTSRELENLKAGITYDESVSSIYRQPKIRVSIIRQPNGQHYLQLNSEQPIIEPVVNFILELNWSTGRLNRQYQLLIDPKLG